MAKIDEGEFELILGNRQLISVFLIVVVLLGVFFSMGYIVGRNSSAPTAEAAHNTAKPADSQIAESPAPSNPSTAAKDPAPEPQAAAPSTPPETTHPATTHPETPPAQKPTPLRTAAVKAPDPVKPAPATVAKSKPAASGPAASGLASVTREPSPGQYWQVVSTSRPDAEIISEALAKKGFRSVVAPAPKEGFFRVLVGPFADSSAQSQARSNLEAAGFKHPIVQRY